jgi:hypothetical protein
MEIAVVCELETLSHVASPRLVAQVHFLCVRQPQALRALQLLVQRLLGGARGARFVPLQATRQLSTVVHRARQLSTLVYTTTT